jgi:UrcA family protein
MRHLMNMKTAIPCAMLAILLGPLSACADVYAAQPGYEFATRTVKYGDLDLTRTAGAVALYSRIQAAARTVCEPVSSSARLESVAITRRCMDQSITRAVADVNAPALTSYHLTRTKQTITLARQP